ncbi:ribonuclease H [Paludibacter sp. 221]|uniref:ribonuclease H1 domain-containing protein n=1 Tax=Paludibacter sp. 221 TaxID=2302939 RepID=UPI0013D84F1B|nr:ribonuclease H family protein [Paludibacter sp. 221]NDV47678.1 ribonuclease H [Paludibacter sp. 221]
MSKSKNKYFVVWEGKTPGIYNSWDECKKQIHGVTAAIYKGFATKEEAIQAINSPYRDYIKKAGKKVSQSSEQNKSTTSPIWESLSVDAACSGNPGMMEYQGVYTGTKELIFHQGPFPDATNNIGEFLALVHGLALLKQRNSNLPLYTDSKTALAWVRNKKAKTELKETERNAVVFDLIERAENWLRTNEYTTRIIKWETSEWGEIPADFGRK